MAAASVAAATAVEAAAFMPDERAAATTMIELSMMTAVAGMSLPVVVLVEVRTIAPAISPTPSPTI
jgi:hypothetical protein